MECNENGRERTLPAATCGRGVKRKCRPGREIGLHLAFPPAVPNASDPISMRVNLVPYCPPEQPLSTDVQPADHPFMNNMDEISYWIYTKRAPCLFNYDNVIKKQIEQAHCSKTKPASIESPCEEVSSPKKKKRKLKLLDEESVSSEKQQNVYFETPKCENQKTAPSSCKSAEIASNIDFNIKTSAQPITAKRIKLQRNCQTSQKKNRLVTSTPKVTNLRRSLRRAQRNNNNTQLNSSFDINNTSFTNGKQGDEGDKEAELVKLVNTNHADQTKSKVVSNKEKNAVVLNGQFEDLSDVSGFTANYIRSTKIHSSKTPRKLRNRNSRNLIKDSKQNASAEGKMLVCVNKGVNSQLPDTTVLNCSTDSSQNVINLVSVKNNEKSTKLNKSTSPLKFMDSKLVKGNTSNKDKQGGKNDLKISFQSKSSGASRYPRRQRNVTIGDSEQNCSKVNNTNVNSPVTRHSTRKTRVNNSDKKENSQDKIKPRTRSGRKLGLNLDQEESGCSMLQLNNSSDPVSSSVALNVASPTKRGKKNNSKVRCLRSRRCRDKSVQDKDSVSDKSDKMIQNNAQRSAVHSTTPKCVRRVKKSLNKTGHSTRDSLRDKSGFAACFSDSDNDSEPLKQRKFFC